MRNQSSLHRAVMSTDQQFRCQEASCGCGTGWSKYVRPQRPMWMSFSAVNIMPLGHEDIAQVMLEILTRSSWHEHVSPGTLLLRTPGRVEN